MSLIANFVGLIAACVGLLALSDRAMFAVSVAGGLILAGVCWYLCNVYTSLWNKRFHVTALHQVLCGIASLLTLCFAVSFVSLKYTRTVAEASVALWQLRLNNDPVWQHATFKKTYNRVRDLGIEDFSRSPSPDMPGAIVPLSQPESKRVYVETNVWEACRNFSRERPLLSKLIWTHATVPSSVLQDDMEQWFRTNNTYPEDHAIAVAAAQIKADLDRQAPHVVALSRMVLLLLFLLAQAIPFGVIGWAAYRDIKARF